MRFILLPVLCLLFISAHAQEQLKAFALCRNGEVVRTLRVEGSGDRFVAIYTKHGVDKEVGRGLNEASIRKITDNIRVNLEKAGWQCKDVQQSTITESKEKK